MIRTWKCLLGAWAICAILSQTGNSQEIEIDTMGVARVAPPTTAPRPADVLYSDSERVWYNDFQPPPGVGVDPVTIPQDNSVGYAVTSDVSEILYRIHRVNRHYHGLDDDGFTSVGAFVPVQVFDNGNALFGVDPRAFVSDNGQGGLNLGGTFRRYSPALHRVFVFSNWLDYDRAGRSGTGYAQWGLHAASIGQFWSVRTNINLPVGQSNEVFNKTFDPSPSFVGNNFVVTANGRVEDAFGQYDIEFSTPIPYFARFGFELGVGYYFLDGARKGAGTGHGVSTRVETQVTEDIWANALVTSDGVFGSNLSLNMEVTLPNGAPSRILRRLPVKSYLTQSDRRPYRVLRNYSRFTSQSVLTSTADCFVGDPIRVAHIDPTAASGGDGTVENPFNSIAAFESLANATQSQYEIVYVHGNTDSGSDANLNTGITLFDCQRLLGAGVDHLINAQQGIFLVGATDSANPLLTNSAAPGAPVITLADDNEVSGFVIDGSGGTGDGSDPNAAIAIDGRDLTPFDGGDPTGVRSFNINRNTIRNSTFGLLVVGEQTGGLQTGIITDNIFTGNFDGAVDLDYSGSAVADLTIEDNMVFAGLGGFNFLADGGPLIRPGFDDDTLAANDDLSTALVPIGFTVNFFGLTESDLFVNNNGNVTFDSALFTFTPFDLLSTSTPIIAPFFADVDTRNHGNEVVYGTDTVSGRNAFGVTWDDVDYFASNPAHGTQLNTFQLVMIDRSDIAAGDFDFEFNYEQILWETGSASGGVGGLGGSSARIGYSNGTNTQFELPGSAVNGAFLDGGPAATSLVQNSLNSSVLGRYRFAVRSGIVNPANQTNGNGIAIRMSDNASLTGSIARNEIAGYLNGLVINGPGNAVGVFNVSDNMIQGAGQHGMLFTTTDNESLTISGTNNMSRLNGIDGLHMETSGNATMTVAFENSQFDSNQGRGVNSISSDSSTLNFALTSPDAALTRSSATNNDGLGMSFEANDSSVQNVTIDDANIVDNGDDGVFIHTLDSGEVAATITGSTLDNNTGLGLHVEAFDSSRVEVTAGGPLAAQGNSFVNSIGAGIGFLLDDDATGVLDIANATITDVQAAGGPLFTGEGVSVVVRQRADLEGSITSSLFENNAADGVRVRVNGNSFPDFARVLSYSIGGPNLADGNVFRNNGGNGLSFVRTGNGQVGTNSSVLIQNNLFESNVGDGFLLDSAGTDNFTDRYTVLNNTSTLNTNGAHLFVRADARLRVDMDQNIFDSNNLDGIRFDEQVNTATDQRRLSGTWTRNEITNNLNDGIGLHGNTSGLVIGNTVDSSLGNHIAFNTFDGINITGPGSLTIGSNLIEENGSNTTGAGDNDAGIDIHSATFFSGTIRNNVIINNNGDGIELESDGVFPVSLDIRNNFIAFNDGRGFDVLAQPSGDGTSTTDIDFHNNVVNENGEEGVYVIFTSSRTQTQDVASTDALLADGAFDDNPRLRFDMTNNQILGNGAASGFSATGLVVRVGTSGGGYGSTNNGGFASNGVSVDSGFSNSGVIMRVADNQFGGNFGDDVWFDSFTSTVDPPATVGTWTDVDFPATAGNPFVYRGDPLARLDLHWSGNSFNTIDVNNVGAFYDNAEAVFKSRDTAQTDPGPFSSGTRRRNAQRVAERFIPILPPVTPGGASDTFLYAGLGQSTFRIRGTTAGFSLDTTPYNDVGDANGEPFPGVNLFGELPFGWTLLP